MELLVFDQCNLNSQFLLCPLFLARLSFVALDIFLKNIAIALLGFTNSVKM